MQQIVRHDRPAAEGATVSDAEKVEFLSRPGSYPDRVGEVVLRETHMSWVFLAGDKVYKLKKPVRFPYLDFSRMSYREAACRAELTLNKRLAPDVYLDVVALTSGPNGLDIGGDGTAVDWLVVMRRLDERDMLDRTILESRLRSWQLDRLAATLVRFYRRATPVPISLARHLADWQQSCAYNKRVLLDWRFRLPAGLIRQIDAAQRGFLLRNSDLLWARIRAGRIVDGHGDLRPEHVWLGDPVKIIDALEFNRGLRAVDPFDDIAFLSLECERLGAGWAGEYVRRRIVRGLRDHVPAELFAFYRCHRAMLRARLAIAHLFESHPRTPEKWPRLARAYLDLAHADARRLERKFRKHRVRKRAGR